YIKNTDRGTACLTTTAQSETKGIPTCRFAPINSELIELYKVGAIVSYGYSHGVALFDYSTSAIICCESSTSSYLSSPASSYFDRSTIFSAVIKGQNRSITSSGFIPTALPMIFLASQVSV